MNTVDIPTAKRELPVLEFSCAKVKEAKARANALKNGTGGPTRTAPQPAGLT